MGSRITTTLSRKIPIIIKYKNGHTNIYENAINRADFNDLDKVEEAIEKINKQANYWPKNLKMTTAILIQEE